MKKILGALIGAVLALTLTAVPAEAAAAPIEIGHRASTGVVGYPENSVKAISYAKRYGASVVEGDVLFTKDNHAVILHDRYLDRTTACTGPVVLKTFAQLRQCAPASLVPQPLAWLKEAKRLGLGVNLELRGNPLPNATQMAGVKAAILREAPASVVISSFDPEVLKLAKSYLGTRVKYAPIIQREKSLFGYSATEHAKQFDLILPDYRILSAAKVAEYHRLGVKVHAWTGNTAVAITQMRAMRVDGMIIDDPRKVS